MPTNVGSLYGYRNTSIQPTDPMHLVYTNSNDLSVNLPIYANDGSLSSCISSVSGDTFEIYPFYYTTISNCITEIRQNIDLELNNSMLTLKTGSKVYVPNGFEQDGVTRKFSEVIINTDLSMLSSGMNAGSSYMLFVHDISSEPRLQRVNNTTLIGSGTTFPSYSFSGHMFYKLDENLIYYHTSSDASSWYAYEYSLPIAIVTAAGSAGFSSIDKNFSGFGYMGSTLFALPGVKGLIPNGKTSTNLLKGVQATTTFVSINSGGGTNQSNITFGLTLTGDLVLNENAIYDTTNNYVYDGATEVNQCFCGTFDKVDGRVSNFYVKPINT